MFGYHCSSSKHDSHGKCGSGMETLLFSDNDMKHDRSKTKKRYCVVYRKDFCSTIQVSHTSTSVALSDRSKYPSLYRAIPTDFPAIQASIALLRMFNWTRIAILGEKTRSGLVSIGTFVSHKLCLLENTRSILFLTFREEQFN